MRVKIFLHGHLKEKIGTDFVYTEARTAYEAMKSIGVRYKKVLKAPLDLGKWKVKLKDYESRDKLMGRIRHNVLHLYPMFRTAKGANGFLGYVQIVAGLLLIAGGILYGQPLAFKVGVALLMGGIYQTFMVPKIDTSELEDTNSMYLGAAEHTTAAGTRIPFGYGKFKITGHYISYNTSSTLYVAG